MTVLALTSTRGAPGVTTTALTLAYTWPHPVILVEADVSGSSSIKAGHMRGNAHPEPNLVDIALAHRNRGLTIDALKLATVGLPLDETRLLLPGIINAAQKASLTPDFWDALAAMLANMARHGYDVIIDAGRQGMIAGPQTLIDRADLVGVITRTRLDDIVNLAANAHDIRGDADAAANRVGAILIGEGQPHNAKDVTRATGLHAWASISFDAVNADRLSGGKDLPTGQRLERSPLIRSARSAVIELGKIERRRREFLGIPEGSAR